MQIFKEPYSTVVEQAILLGFDTYENEHFWSSCGKSKPSGSLMSSISSLFKSDKVKLEDEHFAKDLFFIGAMVTIYTCENNQKHWHVPEDYERITSFFNAVINSYYSEKIQKTFYPRTTNYNEFLREFRQDLEIFRDDYKSAQAKQLSYWTNNSNVKNLLKGVWERVNLTIGLCFLEY